MANNPLKQQFQNFPVPSLDDRAFQDLMEEMRSLIPIYCPDWTNHNPSDPGITLLEMFAYLTEIMLYRMNRVPVKNLFALLDLLGVQPAPPAPARAVISVSPNATSDGRILPPGAAVASRRSGSAEPLVFETESPLTLATAKLLRVISSSSEQTRDVTHLLGGKDKKGFSPFSGSEAVDRYLYLCDGRFLTLREEGMRVHIKFSGPSAYRDLYARWNWEYFNGECWIGARLAVGHGRGEVILSTMPDLGEIEINGESGPWIRAEPRPTEQEPSEIRFEEIEVEVESTEEGVLADAVFLNPGGETVYTNLDLSRVIYPLGEFPKWESSCYIMAQELFRAAGTRVELSFVAPDADAYPRPDPTPDLVLRLEYPVPGNRWELIRTTTPNPFVQSGNNPYQMEDTTRALRRGGVISFLVPEDLVEREIQGVNGPWIRIRLVAGEYRAPESTEPQKVDEAYYSPEPPVGPAFESLRIRSKAPAAPTQKVVSFSDFTFMDLWSSSRPRGSAVQPFPHRSEYTTALYMGFDRPFPRGEHSIYFKIRDDGEAYTQEWEREVAMQRIKWEVATLNGFSNLPEARDGTLHLKRDGYLRFRASPDAELIQLFEQKAYWIRGRLTQGRYDVGPRIEDIRLNTVDALNVQTQTEGRTLPSDGQPYQEVKLNRAPVLGQLRIWIKEKEAPRTPEARRALLDELGDDAIIEDSDGLWCRWRQIDHFFMAGPNTRAFRLDPHNGVVLFGDGVRGKIPPPGARVIRIESYWIGGGARGNVGPHTLTVLKEGNSLVASVDNPFAADGGTESEGLEEAARRGTRQMYSVQRAYRASDFEVLARQASRRVARVACLEPRPLEKRLTKRGEAPADMGDEDRVRIIIVPTELPESPPEAKLLPSQELISRVDRYLDERRTLNVRLSVRGPRYVPFGASCVVYLRGQNASGVEEDIEQRLRRYLHPLRGGEDGRGWQMGQTVRRASLFQVVSGSPQVLSVVELTMNDRDGHPLEGSLALGDDQLPHLMKVRVETAVLS